MGDMEQQGELIPFPPLRETRIFVGPPIPIEKFIEELQNEDEQAAARAAQEAEG
jgi:hypothetical protein